MYLVHRPDRQQGKSPMSVIAGLTGEAGSDGQSTGIFLVLFAGVLKYKTQFPMKNFNDRIPEPKENPLRAICSFSGHKKFKYIIKTSSNG